MFIAGREISIRERSAKAYSSTVFALSELAAEAFYSLISAVIFYILFYFPMGFQYASDRAGFQFLMILILEFYSVTLGQAIASLSPDLAIGMWTNPFIMVVGTLASGVPIHKPQMPAFYRDWLYQLNPMTRLIGAMVVTELHDLKVTCAQSELVVFEPPSGETCQQWAGNFIASVGGYVTNPNATASCEYCQYAVGDDYYTPLGLSFDDRWRDFGILCLFLVSNSLITLVASRFLRYDKR